MLTVKEILVRQDTMSIVEANRIADAVKGGCDPDIHQWLRDVIECDGTNNESKLAAILRGILLAKRTENEP